MATASVTMNFMREQKSTGLETSLNNGGVCLLRDSTPQAQL